MKKKRRSPLTLIEVMLVIVLIGIVGGALAFNLRGALDRGKGFKTQQTQKKIEAILSIEAVEADPEEIVNHWGEIVKSSTLCKFKEKAGHIVDAWGSPFEVFFDSESDEFLITSAHIDQNGKIIG